MSPTLKAALITFIAATITFLTVLLSELIGENPGLVLRGSTNEVLGFRLTPKVCDDSAETFLISQTVTTEPSYEGARVGAWDDGLTKGCSTEKEVWVDYKITQTAGDHLITILGHNVSLKVYNYTMPDQPSLPLLVQMQPWDYHKSINDFDQRDKGYLDVFQALIDHRITPYKTWVTRTNLDETFDLDLPITIVPVTTRNPHSDPELVALNNRCSGRRCVAYLHDEPRESDYPSIDALAARLKAYPNIKSMVTEKYTEAMPNVDIFTEVLHPNFVSGRASMYYVSCMSHGCGPQVGTSSGAPDFVLDRDPIYSRVFLWVAYFGNIQAILYYNSVEGLSQTVYLFTGNRDGQLLYGPGFKQQSLRLKYLRRGSYDYEYLKAARADISSLVRSPFDWEKDEQKYDDLIRQIGGSF